MEDPIFGVCAVLAAVATVVCVRHAYAQRDRTEYRTARHARIAACLSCWVGSTLSTPAIARYVSDATGIEHLAQHFIHLAALSLCASLQVMIIGWTHAPGRLAAAASARAAGALAFAAVLTAQFAFIDTSGAELSTDFAGDGRVTAYLSVFLAYAFISGLEITSATTRLALNAHRHGRPSTRGLALAAAGGAACIAYALTKGSYLATYSMGAPWPQPLERTMTITLAIVYMACVTVGLASASRGGTRGTPSIVPQQAEG